MYCKHLRVAIAKLDRPTYLEDSPLQIDIYRFVYVGSLTFLYSKNRLEIAENGHNSGLGA